MLKQLLNEQMIKRLGVFILEKGKVQGLDRSLYTYLNAFNMIFPEGCLLSAQEAELEAYREVAC